MNTLFKTPRIAAVALAIAVVPFAASTASAAPKTRSTQAKRVTATATATPAATPVASLTPAVSPTTTVSSVHSIGGYVFYNVTYAEAVDLWFAAVSAAPAGYTPPTVYSVSASTTVSGTVEGSGL